MANEGNPQDIVDAMFIPELGQKVAELIKESRTAGIVDISATFFFTLACVWNHSDAPDYLTEEQFIRLARDAFRDATEGAADVKREVC